MYIGIRLQLGLLVLISTLIGLAVVTLATWYTNHSFVLSIRSSRLTLTASLKANQIGNALSLYKSGVSGITTRLLIQSAIEQYNDVGNDTASNWFSPIRDLESALNGGMGAGFLMQAKIFARNGTGTDNNTLVQATGQSAKGVYQLPYTYADGSPVYLGDEQDTSLSYPSELYPNLTFSQSSRNATFVDYYGHYEDMTLNSTSSLLLGPWNVNDTYSMASLTLPINNVTSRESVLAWLTVIVDGTFIDTIVADTEGLDGTGVALLVGPANRTNHLAPGIYNASNRAPENVLARYVLIPNSTYGRHNQARSYNSTFDYTNYRAVRDGWTRPSHKANGAGALLSTRDENGHSIGVGYASVPATDLVDWLFLVEQAHSEVYQPITHLRNLLLACVFGTTGLVVLLVLPIAHYGTSPIRRLRDATKNSVSPPGYLDSSDGNLSSPDELGDDSTPLARKEGFFATISRWRRGSDKNSSLKDDERRRRQFKIPAKVKDRKHYIHDELTDLTTTFNAMSDELMVNYERLDERVQQRTAELEESKQAAEAANEAKTIFVANISHELKTPLNGILGIAQISQSETSLAVLKRDMRLIYNQGDLLTKLIQDLLQFSKNQVDHQIVLEEGEFRIRDITTQVFSTFQLMAQESGIDLVLDYEGPNDSPNLEGVGNGGRTEYGPFGTGRVKDMVLWGDRVRLLQIVLNLTSNAMKFTPRGGSVRIVVRCLGDGAEHDVSRKGSMMSKHNSISRGSIGKVSFSKAGSGRNSRNLISYPSNLSEKSEPSIHKISTANEINALDRSLNQVAGHRTSSPPLGAFNMMFEWEVIDTGPGMSAQVQEKVFEPFFQGDMALSKKFQGTGLGLSICTQLAKLMGGSMSLKSEEGVGSTFTLRAPLKHVGSRAESTASSTGTGSVLPNPSPRNSISGDLDLPTETRSTRSASNASRIPEGMEFQLPGSVSPTSQGPLTPRSETRSVDPIEAKAAAESRSLKVLVAEDNRTNQIVVTRLLKMEKITNVTIAEDGKIAYEMVKKSMARSDNYDLIFMDVQMPNMDGLESTKLIREAGYKNPIVALSAYSEEANVKSCHEAGMDDFVSKPIQLPRLKLVLKTFCPTEYT